MSNGKTAVVLGGYGFIGAACIRALKAAGFRVIGVGRSARAGLRSDPVIDWLQRDIGTVSIEQWRQDLTGVDVVVNAAGALQSGARDDVTGIHHLALQHLVAALQGSRARFIQISAAGVSVEADTAFFRSKALGDQVLMQSALDWVVLRPTLVIGPQAYGGTALLRAAAAVPLVALEFSPDTPMQTVFIDDLADAVVLAATGGVPKGTLADITEAGCVDFRTLTDHLRVWLGFPAPKLRLTLPAPVIWLIGKTADALGWLGWRSPLRTTALRVLARGVQGDSANWIAAGGHPCRSLKETLAALPATTQERWFSRLYLLLPLGIAVLSLFWLVSGIIGLFQWPNAVALLTDRGMGQAPALLAVWGGGVVDILLGLGILLRRGARKMAFGMIAVSLGYILGATLWAGDLWLDPLGPMVKTLPAMMLALFVAALLEDR